MRFYNRHAQAWHEKIAASPQLRNMERHEAERVLCRLGLDLRTVQEARQPAEMADRMFDRLRASIPEVHSADSADARTRMKRSGWDDALMLGVVIMGSGIMRGDCGIPQSPAEWKLAAMKAYAHWFDRLAEQDPLPPSRQMHLAKLATVAYDGPNGPKYHQARISAEEADRIAAEKRAAGIDARAVHLVMDLPDPNRFIRGDAPHHLYLRLYGDEFAKYLEDHVEPGVDADAEMFCRPVSPLPSPRPKRWTAGIRVGESDETGLRAARSRQCLSCGQQA